MKVPYTALSYACQLTTSSLEECIHRGLPPSWVFTFRVGVDLATYARGLVRALYQGTRENPLMPQVNVIVDMAFEPQEWCIESRGMAFGSIGV